MSTDDKRQSINERRQSDAISIDSELIALVYEMAFDPYFWPDLLESVGSLFEDRRSDRQPSTTFPENDLEHIQLFSNQIDKTEAQRLATLYQRP